jgi:hypothetical protein
MSLWRALAAGIVVLAVGSSILLFAPADNARRPTTDRPYPGQGQLAGGPMLSGVYELLAIRSLGAENGREVKGLIWHAMAPLLLAVALAAGTWRLLQPKCRQRTALWPEVPGEAGADGLAGEERRALLRDWPGAPEGGATETPPGRLAFRLAVGGLIAYGLVNLLSCTWSDAPELSLRAAADRAIGILWAVTIAAVLRRRWAGRAAIGVAILSAAAAGLGLWFHAEGNAP